MIDYKRARCFGSQTSILNYVYGTPVQEESFDELLYNSSANLPPSGSPHILLHRVLNIRYLLRETLEKDPQ